MSLVVVYETPAMALHRGRIDLLEAHLDHDRSLRERRFEEREVYPPGLGIEPALESRLLMDYPSHS